MPQKIKLFIADQSCGFLMGAILALSDLVANVIEDHYHHNLVTTLHTHQMVHDYRKKIIADHTIIAIFILWA